MKALYSLEMKMHNNFNRFFRNNAVFTRLFCFVGIPLCMLAALFISTISIAVPIGLLFGWL